MYKFSVRSLTGHEMTCFGKTKTYKLSIGLLAVRQLTKQETFRLEDDNNEMV